MRCAQTPEAGFVCGVIRAMLPSSLMPTTPTVSSATLLIALAENLRRELASLHFSPPVTHTYNPLEYAWNGHKAYLAKFGQTPKRVVFLGMNPGPWGMTQTGVPFGEIAAVRAWMGLDFSVQQPVPVHPKRPITGLECRRSEVSGRRLWGMFAARYPDARDFFRDHFVLNYCPLVWMEESGKNRTPDKLPAAERAAIEAPCLNHLRKALELMQPEWVVGVGGYAEGKLAEVTTPSDPWQISRVPHPSPANPTANRDWAGAAIRCLRDAGIWQD